MVNNTIDSQPNSVLNRMIMIEFISNDYRSMAFNRDVDLSSNIGRNKDEMEGVLFKILLELQNQYSSRDPFGDFLGYTRGFMNHNPSDPVIDIIVDETVESEGDRISVREFRNRVNKSLKDQKKPLLSPQKINKKMIEFYGEVPQKDYKTGRRYWMNRRFINSEEA